MNSSGKFYDERYEFDAPQQFIDFNNLQDDDHEDSFFDCGATGRTKSMQDLSLGTTPVAATPTVQGGDTVARASPQHSNNDGTPKQTGNKGRKSLRSRGNTPNDAVENVVTSVAPNSVDTCKSSTRKSSTNQTIQNSPMDDVSGSPQLRINEPQSVIIESTGVAITVTTDKQDEQESMDTSDSDLRPVTRSSRKGPLGDDGVFLDPPMRHSPRLAAIAKVLNTSVKACSPRHSSASFKARRRSVSAGPGTRRARTLERGPLSAEDWSHLAQFATLEPAAERGRQPRVKAGRLMPTRPVEFKFATDSRLKGTAVSIDEPLTVADFARSLRNTAKSAATVTSKAHRGPTKPQPFKLHETRKTAADLPQADKFISLAELNMKFHSQTPQRFKSKPKKAGEFHGWHSGSMTSINSVGITRPHSPSLATSCRTRAVNHPTREEVEEQELQEALQKKFKSKPLNPKIFEQPKINVVLPKKDATVPVPFNIKQTKKQLQQANSVPSFLNDSTASSVPHSGVPQRQDRSNTRMQPFSFDNRDQNILRKKHEKIEQVIAKEKGMADFHAHRMPVFEGGPKGLPDKKPPSATKVAPFELKIDQRAVVKQQIIEKENTDRETREREQRQFHARPASVTQKKPFQPLPSNKIPTEISGFVLNTEKRSEQRLEFDMHLKRKEDDIMAQKRQVEERREADEETQLTEQRSRIVHRARPMPQFPAPQLLPCDRPVTQPQSPKFATDSRLRSTRSRNNVNSTADSSSGSGDSTFVR